MRKIGKILRSLRIREGLTQEQMAQILNVKRSTIGMYENDERQPSLEILEKYADYFNVDMNYITGSTQEEYYYDLQAKQIAQEIYERPELRVLFDAARNVKPEDLEFVKQLLFKLAEKEGR